MAMTETRESLMALLGRTLPESDIDTYPGELFGEFVDHALFLRRTLPWCRELDGEIFFHYVLFPRVNDEDLSFNRRVFFDALADRVLPLPDTASRVLEVNRWCHEIASYEPQDERTASPLTVYRSGSGRCGEESAFLVSALRSVGIPARQVYVPRWSHCDDNHAWVEALCDGAWRFLGACEPEPVLDRGWFNTVSSRAVLVHSRLFGEGVSPLHGERIGSEGAVTFYNQTPRYAVTREYVLRALVGDGAAPGARFQMQILNDAGFRTVAVLTADGRGEARARLGEGDIHVLATLGPLMAEGDCRDGGVTLRLGPPPAGDTGWRELDFRAPEASPVNPSPLDAGQRARRAEVLRRGNALRERRLAELCRGRARGNHPVISAFLTFDGDPRRELLISSLSDKDLRDVTLTVLEDHLQNTPPPGGLPLDIYVPYVLCPRIELEPLTPWRGGLRRVLPAALSPRELWLWLRGRVDTCVRRTYGNLVWPPLAALDAGRCDGRSLGILWVACLRALGTPARLRPLDGAPEYWEGGVFRTPDPEGTGTLALTGRDVPRTLARLTPEGWRPLNLPGDTRQTVLPEGYYRLVTSRRLPGGTQLAAVRDFPVPRGGTVEADIPAREYELADMLYSQPMPPTPAVTREGAEVPDVFRTGSPCILCWISPGSEPTEHLTGELAALGDTPEIFLLPESPGDLGRPALAGLLARGRVRVLFDEWEYDSETVARQLGLDPSALPLALVCDGRGRAVYASAGYQVGSGELLEHVYRYVIRHNKEKER